MRPHGIFDWCEHFPSTHITRRFPAGRVDTKLGRFHHGVDGAQNRGVAFDSLEDVGLAAPGVEVVGTTKPPARSHDLYKACDRCSFIRSVKGINNHIDMLPAAPVPGPSMASTLGGRWGTESGRSLSPGGARRSRSRLGGQMQGHIEGVPISC